MIPTLDLGLRFVLLFGVGFLSWFLALVRTFATIDRRTSLLCSLIFVEEVFMIWTGVWLARTGTMFDVLAVALGGPVAAFLAIKGEKLWRKRRVSSLSK